MKAVLRAITKLPEIRDRSVVRSSVMPSAKYSWSGSRDRFSNGNTTNDRRGIGAAGRDEICGFTGGAWTESIGVVLGHIHQAPDAIQSTAMALAGIISRRNRRAGPSVVGADVSGVDATVAALI